MKEYTTLTFFLSTFSFMLACVQFKHNQKEELIEIKIIKKLKII